MVINILCKSIVLVFGSLILESIAFSSVLHAHECIDLSTIVSPGPGSRITVAIKNSSRSSVQVDRSSLPWLSSSAAFRISAIESSGFLPLDSIAAFVDSFDKRPMVIEPGGSLVGEVELDRYAYNASKHIERHGLVVLWLYCVGQLGCDCNTKGGILVFEKSG